MEGAKRVCSGAKLAILRMAIDVGGHEWTARNDSAAALTRVRERVRRQPRRNPAASELSRNERVIELEKVGIQLAVRDVGSLAADVGSEPPRVGLVVNREGHCFSQGASVP